MKILFKDANDELEKISQWFKANKLSLNDGKNKFTLFRKPHDKDNLPLQLPNLKINNNEIKRSSSIKFLRVLVDENLTWIDHITLVENKLSKNLGLLHKAKNYLNKKSMVSLYYSFIHSYLNYGNIAWCSTSMTKLKKLLSKQKETLRTIPIPTAQSESRSKQIMRENCVLNIYQLNIYVLNLMFKVKNGLIPDAFQNKFNMISHDYFTKNNMRNFKEPRFSLKITKFAIS